MIIPKTIQTTAAVAAHYDELDEFYRDIWGEHVHHGFWATGQETPEQAVIALIDLLAEKLQFAPGQTACDIGCGYGATAQYFADRHQVRVTGLSVSAAQIIRAETRIPTAGKLNFLCQDFLSNDLPDQEFDRAYAVESSEHMPDKPAFFAQAYRTLKPGGRFTICAWLAADAPKPWEIRHLLEPICREGRLPGMGNEADYRAMAAAAGFSFLEIQDISANVSRTWRLCAQRFAGRLVTQPHYIKFLINRTETNRIFAATLFRLIAAYRTGAMRYCVLTFTKPESPAAPASLSAMPSR